nr:putative retrotransposon Orf1 [Ipomoea batatas]
MPPRTRNKERAKKSKHNVGSSSGVVQGESDLLIAECRSLRHLNGTQLARVEELQAKGASGGFYFDFPLLYAYGCRAEVERMAGQRYWEHLFSWRDNTYEPVVHEFIATFEPVPSNHMCTPSMKFTLFGREYQVSLIQLGRYLGFYTQDDINTDEWRNLPTDFDSDAAAEAYWQRITGGNGGRFTEAKPNTSKILSPALKVLKLMLNLTFGGRNKNLHKVYRIHLFRLWSLEMNEPIQMACLVQQLFHSQANPKCPYVWIGPVVTRLCQGLGLQSELAREKRIATMRPLGVEQLNRSYAPRIEDVPMHPQDEPQENEPVIEGGPDVPPEYAEYPPVYDWASMRALQIQLHTHSMDTFNRRMDLQHEELMRQNEAIVRQHEAYARQEERQEQQFQAIEQLRLWMEHRFPPPSQGGDGPY